MIEANWLIFAAALLICIVIAWWLFARGSKGPERSHRPDVLDEGVGPAQRNQALIDAAPPAAQYELPVHIDPPAMAGTMAGLGEVIAVAAQEEVDRAVDHDHTPPQTIAAEPAPDAEPAPATADDLRRIKGLGPKLQTLLASLGVTTFAQIAAWTDADLDALDANLGAFAGRPRRDKWVEQARLLASGDTGGYEAEFGKL
ncbi:hypothetical protein ACFSTD_16755 [Novosphingobium colocasiae]|nr:hypothetical protein [Novosphingobium colocasiae]